MVPTVHVQTAKNRCSKSLIWGLMFIIIAIRIVGLILFTIWLCDCFFREFKMSIACKDFSLYPYPEIVSVIWLTIISCTSLFLIFYARRLPEYPSTRSVIIYLLGKKYFYKLCVTLILVLIYDLITIVGVTGLKSTIVYASYMLERITSVALMLTLNFLPRFVKKNDPNYKLKTAVFKVTLLVYTIEYYVVYALGTVVAAYKLVSVPTCTWKQLATMHNASHMVLRSTEGRTNVCHDSISVAMLLLLMVLLSLRHQLADFFLTKIFRENTDILEGPLQEDISISKDQSTESTPLMQTGMNE